MNVLVISSNHKTARQLQSFLADEAGTAVITTAHENATYTASTLDADLIFIELTDDSPTDPFDLIDKLNNTYNIIVAIGANSNQVYKRAAFNAGADDFIVKPITQAEIINKVKLFRRLLKNDADSKQYQRYSRAEHALDLSQVGVWEWDIATDRITWSKEIVEVFGLGNTETHLDFEAYAKLVHPDDLPTLQSAIQDALANPGEPYYIEHRYTTPEGKDGWVEGRGKVLVDRNGSPIKMLGTVMDVTRRKVVELALRDSEAKYKALYMGIPLATYTWEKIGDKVVMTDLNTEAIHVNEGRIDMVLGVEAEELFKNDPDIVEDLWYCLEEKTNRQREMVYRFITTGRTLDLNVLYGFVEPNRVIIHVQDITRQKQFEQELRTSEERYRRLLESVSDYAFSSIINADQSIVMDWVSGGFYESLGYHPEEILNNPDITADEIVHPDDLETMHNALADVSNNKRSQIEVRIRRKDGEYVWLQMVRQPIWDDNEERVTRFYGTAIDITGRKQIEATRAKAAAELRASEERYRIILEASFDYAFAIAVKPDQSLIVEWVSGNIERVLGYRPEELVGNEQVATGSIVHPDDLKVMNETLNSLFDNQGNVSEGRFLRKDGTSIWLRIARQPIWDEEEQRVVRWYGAATDITEQKAAEETRRQNERLEANLAKERAIAETRSQLISVLAHELRTPLTVIYSNSDFVRSYWDRLTDDQIIRKLDISMQQVEQLDSMLDEISLLSKADRGYLELQPETVDITKLSQDIVEIGYSLLGDNTNIRFQTELPYGSIITTADSKLLTHALVNLLSNAMKYSPDGGLVEYKVTALEDSISFKVTDQGIGIPSETLPNIFKPFYRAPNVNGIHGTGIGLSIVKQVIDLHNGTINCDSRVGEGTKFIINLPLWPVA